MPEQPEHTITEILRMLARKGTYELLLRMRDSDAMHYNEVLRYAMESRLFKSRASTTTILNDLTDYGLLDRIVVQPRPTRIKYRINKMGLETLEHLERIKYVVSERRPAE